MSEKKYPEANEIFQGIIETAKENLMEDKELLPLCLVIIKNDGDNKLEICAIPGMFGDEQGKQLFADTISGIARGINESNGREVLCIITTLDGRMNHIIAPEGKELKDVDPIEVWNSEGYVKPLDDPHSKEVLIFTLETLDYSRTLIYEYIRSESNDIVVNETPYIDTDKEDTPKFEGRFQNLFKRK